MSVLPDFGKNFKSIVPPMNEYVSIRPKQTIFGAEFDIESKYFVACDSTGKLSFFTANQIVLKHSIPLRQFTAHTGAIYGVKFTPFGDCLLSFGDDGLKVWNWGEIVAMLNSNEEEFQPSPHITYCPGEGVEVNSVCFIPETSNAVLACGDSCAHVVDYPSGQKLFTLKGHQDYLHCCVMINDSLLATGSDGGAVKIWDLEKRIPIKDIKYSSSESVCALQYIPSKQLLAIGGHSGSIIFYNLKTGVSTSAKTVSTHAFVLFSNDQLVSAGRDNHLHFWDTSSLQIEKKISGPSSSLFALCKSSTNVLVTGGLSSTLDVYLMPIQCSHSISIV